MDDRTCRGSAYLSFFRVKQPLFINHANSGSIGPVEDVFEDLSKMKRPRCNKRVREDKEARA
jgi:hypothetical protein